MSLGLVQHYAYNHGEAARCFRAAQSLDESCVLAHCGLALARGASYNHARLTDDELAEARRHAADAVRCCESARPTSVERALSAALVERTAGDDEAAWASAYASALRRLHASHPGDLDVCALFAEALMQVAPWALWDFASGTAAPSVTPEVVRLLADSLALPSATQHAGLLHFQIHVLEMSPSPVRALLMYVFLLEMIFFFFSFS